MPKVFYSWRLKREVPLLSDEEYAPIARVLRDRLSSIKNYREMYKAQLSDACKNDQVGQSALAIYAEICGENLDHPDQLYSVRLSDYGLPCPQCAKPFRTPNAKLCAECGFELPEGEVAGSLAASA